MGKKTMPFSEFKKKFDKKSQGAYTYLEGYTRMSRKIKIKCNICDHVFEPIASYFVNTNTGCKNCDLIKRSKKYIEDFEKQKEAIKLLTNGEYELLEYNGLKEKALFLHKKCGKQYKTLYQSFVYQNYRCECSRRRSRPFTLEELQDLYKNRNFKVIKVEYPNCKITIRCNECNIEHVKTKHALDKNYKFECCKKKERQNKLELKRLESIQYKKNLEEQKEYKKKKEGYIKQLRNETRYYKYYTEFKSIHGDDIEIKERVYKVEDKFLVKCNICNHEWRTNFKYLRRGKGCPLCKSSKGEKVINKYLIDNNYSFEREYSFKDSEIKSLRFDFAVNLNNKVYLIEFDGKQHFNPEAQFGDNNKEDKFNKLKTNDERKDTYCKNNNISLLRIPYWEIDNIHNLIGNFLKTEE